MNEERIARIIREHFDCGTLTYHGEAEKIARQILSELHLDREEVAKALYLKTREIFPDDKYWGWKGWQWEYMPDEVKKAWLEYADLILSKVQTLDSYTERVKQKYCEGCGVYQTYCERGHRCKPYKDLVKALEAGRGVK